MRYIVPIVILLFALSRGTQRVLTSLALNSLDGWSVTALSLSFACLIWLPIAWWRKWLVFDKNLWLRSLPLGVVNIAIPAIAFTFAQLFVTAGVAALFVAFLPVVVAILGWVFLKEKLSAKVWVGIFLATIGVTVLTLGKNGALDVTNWWAGVGLLALGVLSAAIVYVGWRKLLSERPAVELLAPQLVISTLCVIPLAFIFGKVTVPSVEVFFLLGALGTVNYIIPQIAMFWLLVRTTAVRSSLANYLAPVFAIILGAIILDQPITWVIMSGGILIILGAVFVNTAKLKK